MDVLPLRLVPGVDLRRELEVHASTHGCAFVIGGIGSLHGVRLRLAAAQDETRIDGPFEVLSLSGTLAKDGAHLHMAVAGARGDVLGGHVGYGNTVRTTVEVLLATIPGWELRRAFDPVTGSRELVVRRLPTGHDGEGGA